MRWLKAILKGIFKKHQLISLEYPVHFKPRYVTAAEGGKAHPELLKIIESNRKVYHEYLQAIMSYSGQLQKITQTPDETLPHWNNGFLPGLDILGVYTMLSHHKPKKYLEVGSGNSTKVAYLAKKDQSLETEIISIDPFPRAEIDALSDKIVRKPFETVTEDITNELNAGDILFIDNSHRILPNSDAMVFFMETLPRIKPGVIIQIHDIYLPYDYPQFMCDRAYSEQYGLAFYLLAAPEKFEVLLPNFFISADAELSTILDPFWNHPNLTGVEKHGGSFWFRKKE